MSTFEGMGVNIATDINRIDLISKIEDNINRAIRYYYNSDDFYFNEGTGTFSTVADQQIYTSSNTNITDIASILQVKIEINTSTNMVLTPRTFQYIQEVNVNQTTGQPFDYAYYNQAFYIYPVPDNAYTITVYYNKSYADLSGSDSNAFTTDAEDLIEARVRWMMYSHVIRNPEAAQTAKAEEMDALQALRISSGRKMSTGLVRPIRF